MAHNVLIPSNRSYTASMVHQADKQLRYFPTQIWYIFVPPAHMKKHAFRCSIRYISTIVWGMICQLVAGVRGSCPALPDRSFVCLVNDPCGRSGLITECNHYCVSMNIVSSVELLRTELETADLPTKSNNTVYGQDRQNRQLSIYNVIQNKMT